MLPYWAATFFDFATPAVALYGAGLATKNAFDLWRRDRRRLKVKAIRYREPRGSGRLDVGRELVAVNEGYRPVQVEALYLETRTGKRIPHRNKLGPGNQTFPKVLEDGEAARCFISSLDIASALMDEGLGERAALRVVAIDSLGGRHVSAKFFVSPAMLLDEQ